MNERDVPQSHGSPEESGTFATGTEQERATAREALAAQTQALGAKAAQIGKTVAEGVEGVGQTVRGSVQTISSTAADTAQLAAEAAAQVADGVRNAAARAGTGAQAASEQVRENPIGFVLGMGALGLLLGLLFPSTSLEREKLAPLGDQAAERFGPRQILAQVKAAVFDSSS